MTPEDLASMTLGDLEALAERMDRASRTIRDAMALLGGQSPQAPVQPHAVLGAQYIPTEPMRVPSIRPAPPGVLPSFEPEEHLPHLDAQKAKRAAFLAQKRADPGRTELLKQFAHDGNGAIEEES